MPLKDCRKHTSHAVTAKGSLSAVFERSRTKDTQTDRTRALGMKRAPLSCIIKTSETHSYASGLNPKLCSQKFQHAHSLYKRTHHSHAVNVKRRRLLYLQLENNLLIKI